MCGLLCDTLPNTNTGEEMTAAKVQALAATQERLSKTTVLGMIAMGVVMFVLLLGYPPLCDKI